MVHKLIIDADPGIGDALAIALALLDPEIDLLAVTATAGAVSGPAATRNVQAIIEHLDPPKWPRIGESTADAARAERDYGSAAVSSAALNGPSGLGDWEFQVADLHNRHESAKLMTDIVRSEPNEVTLLTLGPLTNVELACERFTGFLRLLKGLICLGGSVEVGGDVTAAAEFNMHADPEAAWNVLRSPATKTLVPLDVTNRMVLTVDQFQRLPMGDDSPVGRLFESLLPFALRAHHERLGLEGIRLHEVAALAAVRHPELFVSRPMVIDVETSGDLTRGMTVFDRRGIQKWQTNIEVLVQVDVQAVLDDFAQVVNQAARR